MKALSICQPWAWLIVQGFKDVENRSWKTNYRGTLLIHASKSFDYSALDFLYNREWDKILEKVNEHFNIRYKPLNGGEKAFGACTCPEQFGGIVGQTEIIDCATTSPSKWFFGPNGFILQNSKPLPFRPYKGQLGLFEVEVQNAN